jgi:hypothetical protein
MDLGTLSVDVATGMLVRGWWLVAHPGLAVLALLGSTTAAACARMGAGR